ncbi:hypothetical protein BVI434_940005 [Burkholderia vietnamiensis]|nr:hypothetical protein BVI434_940005 [Burkholderia vietnamiensis]
MSVDAGVAGHRLNRTWRAESIAAQRLRRRIPSAASNNHFHAAR